jgi:hypothetical protein
LGKPPAGRGKSWIIGPPIDPTPTKTGEGNVHKVEVPNFKKAYGLPVGADVRSCRIEAYFDQDMGGDRWLYHPGRGQIAVK